MNLKAALVIVLLLGGLAAGAYVITGGLPQFSTFGGATVSLENLELGQNAVSGGKVVNSYWVVQAVLTDPLSVTTIQIDKNLLTWTLPSGGTAKAQKDIEIKVTPRNIYFTTELQEQTVMFHEGKEGWKVVDGGSYLDLQRVDVEPETLTVYRPIGQRYYHTVYDVEVIRDGQTIYSATIDPAGIAPASQTQTEAQFEVDGYTVKIENLGALNGFSSPLFWGHENSLTILKNGDDVYFFDNFNSLLSDYMNYWWGSLPVDTTQEYHEASGSTNVDDPSSNRDLSYWKDYHGWVLWTAISWHYNTFTGDKVVDRALYNYYPRPPKIVGHSDSMNDYQDVGTKWFSGISKGNYQDQVRVYWALASDGLSLVKYAEQFGYMYDPIKQGGVQNIELDVSQSPYLKYDVPDVSLSPVIQIYIPTELADTLVLTPHTGGSFKIVSVNLSKDKVYEGGSCKLTAEIKNIGNDVAVAHWEISADPSNAVSFNQVYGEISLNSGETGTISVYITPINVIEDGSNVQLTLNVENSQGELQDTWTGSLTMLKHSESVVFSIDEIAGQHEMMVTDTQTLTVRVSMVGGDFPATAIIKASSSGSVSVTPESRTLTFYSYGQLQTAFTVSANMKGSGSVTFTVFNSSGNKTDTAQFSIDVGEYEGGGGQQQQQSSEGRFPWLLALIFMVVLVVVIIVVILKE